MSQQVPVPILLIQLRFLVGALGERLEWWPSQFTSEIGLRRLAIPFPRTTLRAAVESVTITARRDHDDRVSPASVHLFRLPGAQEDAIAHHLSQSIHLSAPPASAEGILAALDDIGPADGSVAPDGPCSLGRAQRTRLKAGAADIARIYAAAARSGQRAIPYFEADV
ncbi:BrxE family protein [Thiocapsa sp.]|uniref:BrxE family protein n=1 Tax=Thiocapsa sp. TaxID=2024551 RepID=UPI003594562E